MTDTALVAQRSQAEAAPRVKPARGAGRDRHDALVFLLITAVVLGAWAFTRLGLYTTKSNIAYWLGVAGGVGMLLLLSYPMRKHLRFMRSSGPARHWFVAHMLLGVSGPLLILLHSNFQIGSLNGGVAFYSMVTVAASGVIGRYLFLQLHRSLNGEKLGLDQLRARLSGGDSPATQLRFAPAALERCRRFETWALECRVVNGVGVMRAMLLVPWLRWRAEFACRAELRRRLVVVAQEEGWSRRKQRARLRVARRLVHDYLAAAQRVAMFSAWERIFSWWHVAHVPFVYILVLSSVVHVVAVHAY